MSRVEVGCENLRLGICCGDEVRRKALPTAEVAVSERLTLSPRRRNTLREGCKTQDCGRLDSAKVVDVCGVGDISGAPLCHRLSSGENHSHM